MAVPAGKNLRCSGKTAGKQGIDLFSGLLYCADCGHKLTFQAKACSPESKHAYFCGRYRNRQRLSEKCTAHYIRKVVLKELVLADMQRVMAYAKGHEREFVAAATQYGEQAARKAVVRKVKKKIFFMLNSLFKCYLVYAAGERERVFATKSTSTNVLPG